MPRVCVAMSGGVDSTVAALLLSKQGYQVFGVSLRLFERQDSAPSSFGSCCSLEDIHLAKKAARMLGIPHYTLDLTRDFKKSVIKDFSDQYFSGKTPNPCIVCNHIIKFDVLLKKVIGMGADFLATGHYAVKKKIGSRYYLSKSADQHKDQTYFLYHLGQNELRHVLFPLGRFTKDRVRSIARTHRLPNADKKDSQEICFVPGNDYEEYLKENGAVSVGTGPVYDTAGKKIGVHKGYPFYTVGQRKGLQITVPGPQFVLAVNARDNSLVAGSKKESYRNTLHARDVSWVAGKPAAASLSVQAQIRYRHIPAAARLKHLSNERVQVVFRSPQYAVSPGQAIVFYSGKRLLGGGTIT